MSSFAAIPFKVIPDGDFFPQPSRNSDGLIEWSASIQFATAGDKDSLHAKLTNVVWRRPLGTMNYNGHIEAGYGSDTLIIPEYGGNPKTYTAVMIKMDGEKGYGRYAIPTFQADVTFIITSGFSG